MPLPHYIAANSKKQQKPKIVQLFPLPPAPLAPKLGFLASIRLALRRFFTS